MIRFAARFADFQILVPLAQQLSWSHFIALLPLKSDDAFMFYAQDAVKRCLGKRELRRQISRKAYERSRGNPDACTLSGLSPTATDLNLLDCRVATLLAKTGGTLKARISAAVSRSGSLAL